MSGIESGTANIASRDMPLKGKVQKHPILGDKNVVKIFVDWVPKELVKDTKKAKELNLKIKQKKNKKVSSIMGTKESVKSWLEYYKICGGETGIKCKSMYPNLGENAGDDKEDKGDNKEAKATVDWEPEDPVIDNQFARDLNLLVKTRDNGKSTIKGKKSDILSWLSHYEICGGETGIKCDLFFEETKNENFFERCDRLLAKTKGLVD
jgi:hypothetical protein